MTYVIINDFIDNKRTKLLYLDEDFDLPAQVWDKSDQLLQDLQYLETFSGRLRWRDLDPIHYRDMIAKNLQYVATMPDDERLDEEHPVVSSLNFLICALIYCLEKRTDSHLEWMKINRVGDVEVSIEFHAEMQLETIYPGKKKADTPTGFSVVVDNT
jgi:hypothetical protein